MVIVTHSSSLSYELGDIKKQNKKTRAHKIFSVVLFPFLYPFNLFKLPCHLLAWCHISVSALPKISSPFKKQVACIFSLFLSIWASFFYTFIFMSKKNLKICFSIYPVALVSGKKLVKNSKHVPRMDFQIIVIMFSGVSQFRPNTKLNYN